MSTKQQEIPTTDVDPVCDMLMERLECIPGVRVATYVSRPLGLRIFKVAVTEGDTEAEMAVYRAELEVYQKFPTARIELYLV